MVCYWVENVKYIYVYLLICVGFFNICNDIVYLVCCCGFLGVLFLLDVILIKVKIIDFFKKEV